jgi:TRAP-type uncharacterized transport system substrate-binding protein
MTPSVAVAQQNKPIFKLCTGGAEGNYIKAGHILKSKVTSVIVEPVVTQGSLDNLDRMIRGECDGGFVQSDSLLVYSARNAQALSAIERAGVLYQEQVHLLCNRNAGIKRIVDLTSKHRVAIGPDGSGARTTWDGFILADKKLYQPVQTDSRAGPRALAAVSDGSEVQCLIYIAALGSSYLKNDASQHGDTIVIVPADDRDMAKTAKDNRGKTVYSYGTIPSNTYPRIQPKGTVFGTKEVDTIQVDALFVSSVRWIETNADAYNAVLRGFASAKPDVNVKILGLKN